MDMSRYLGLFVTEASEHLEELAQDLVQLEKAPGPEVVDSMFRHAHSVKGMASSMGFEPIATLAHRVEDLVEAVRQDKSRLTAALVDLLLASSDMLLAQVRAVADNQTPDAAEMLLAQLGACVSALTGQAPGRTRVAQALVYHSAGAAKPPAPAPESPERAPSSVAASGLVPEVVPTSSVDSPASPPANTEGAAEATASAAEVVSPLMDPGALDVTPARGGPSLQVMEWSTRSPPARAPSEGAPPSSSTPRWAVRLRIAPNCQVPGVRAFLVHKRLTGLGPLFDLRPSLEDLKAGRIPEGFIQVELESAAGEEGVRGVLRNVAEVEVVSVHPVVVAVAATPAPVVAPAPVQTQGASEAQKTTNGPAAARTVRVSTDLLDYFLDSVGELLLATARLREAGKVLPETVRGPVEEGVYRLHALVKDLHDKVMSARMTPLSVITDRLPRAARDVARRRDLEVDLLITGAEIELDRAILDDLADPLMHLMRNCIDHGIETPEERAKVNKGPRGRVLVTVRRQRDRVVLELEDDGRGMDADKLRAAAVQRGLITSEAAAELSQREALLLSCLPGVSTARDVSVISGRGVGMDAVKRVVENVGGTLEIDSEKGRGTRFTLRLPLTVAVVHLLLVGVGEEIYGLPITKVLAAMEADEATLGRSRDAALIPYAHQLLPVYPLEELVGLEVNARAPVRPYVVMEGETGKVALAVDTLLGQEEVVLKALSRPLDLLPGLAGVTILGSGRPVFILDVPRLLAP